MLSILAILSTKYQTSTFSTEVNHFFCFQGRYAFVLTGDVGLAFNFDVGGGEKHPCDEDGAGDFATVGTVIEA